MTAPSPALPPDHEQRSRALDPRSSFLVQAPAGSGKTELLIQRYLVLLAQVNTPESVFAITFTRKAAGEMRARVLEALCSAQENAPLESHKLETWKLARAVWERDQELRWELLASPQRMRIQTIDSLCSWLAGRLPVLGGLGGNIEPSENPDEAYQAAAAATIRMLDSDGPLAAGIRELLLHLENDASRLAALISSMLKRRDQWLPRVGLSGDVDDLRPMLEASLKAAVDYELSIAAAGMPAVEPVPQSLAEWKDLAARLLTKQDEPRKKLPPSWAGMELPRRFTAALRRIPKLPPPGYEDDAWQILAAALRVLRHAVGELKLQFQQRREVDFIEQSLAALRALGDENNPTDLALAMGERIEHLLIDEMQDTSVTHLELIRRLTAGWTGANEEPPRTLFLVGDPRQSIYLFREAEVANFIDLRHNGLGELTLEPLTLEANFRSTAGIVDWVNSTFPGVLPPIEDAATGAIPYGPPADATRPADDSRAVYVHPFAKGDDSGEAECVAGIVEEALGETEGAIAVLARRRADLEYITAALKRRGIPFRAVDIDPLDARPVVLDLLSLTRALLHPMDRVSWLAILRAPWGGLTLADLDTLAEGSPQEAIYTLLATRGHLLTADGHARWTRIEPILTAALDQTRRVRLRALVEDAWRSLGGPQCLESGRDAADAESFLGLLDDLDEGGEASFAALDAEVARLYAAPDPIATGRVQVMTIHKSKGLEFDTVIVPGLGKSKRTPEPELIRMVRLPLDGVEHVLMAAVAPTGQQEQAGKYLGGYQYEREANEARRLLYVAATRAKRKLHLLGAIEYNERKGEWKPPRSGTLLHALWDAVQHEFAGMPVPQATAQTAIASYPQLRRVVEGWQTPPPEAAIRWRQDDSVEAQVERHSYEWVGDTLRHVGVAVHAWLFQIAKEGVEEWNERRIADRAPAIRAQLATLGVPPDELDGALDRVQRALLQTLASDRGRWLLTRHREDQREYAITAYSAGVASNYRVDCMFVDQDGVRWVIDFKTSSHEGGGLEAFLDEEQRRYREQLERYAHMLSPGEPVRLGLFFPLLGEWREWSAPQVRTAT